MDFYYNIPLRLGVFARDTVTQTLVIIPAKETAGPATKWSLWERDTLGASVLFVDTFLAMHQNKWSSIIKFLCALASLREIL